MRKENNSIMNSFYIVGPSERSLRDPQGFPNRTLRTAVLEH